MKTMVKLAVFIATLLLLTGGAFAVPATSLPPGCNCYDVACYGLDYPFDFEIDHPVTLCFGPNNQGEYDGLCGDVGYLSLFFDDPVQALGFDPISGGYLKFRDSRLTVLNGTWNCFGFRYNLQGRITDPSNCPNPCIDGVKDGLETDVDCGGPFCQKCAILKSCNVNSDCLSGFCSSGTCDAII
jgi:hypothetical protein